MCVTCSSAVQVKYVHKYSDGVASVGWCTLVFCIHSSHWVVNKSTSNALVEVSVVEPGTEVQASANLHDVLLMSLLSK